MKNANEMRIMTVNAIHNQKRIEQNKAIKYVEDHYTNQIERAAKMGKFEIHFEVEENINMDYVVEYITANGFEVETKERAIRINWEN